MRKSCNHGGLFVDTGLLRDHVSKLREEKKTAVRLYESVEAMRNYADPEAYGQYTVVLRDIKQLIEYFDRMARVLAEAGDEAVHLSREIGDLLKDDAAQVRHVSSHAFML